MTRAYAARRLLEHGPIKFREFLKITNWDYKQARSTIKGLAEAGDIRSTKDGWELCIGLEAES
jgi:hypothetical protein